MLVAFSWNAPSSVTKSRSSSGKAKGHSAEPSYAEKLYVPMMITKKPRLDCLPSRPALPIEPPKPAINEAAPAAPTKPAPQCWCPLSAPAKVCWRPNDDRLHPGRAFYQCANVPSCSFFAWCESNEEFAASRANKATTTTTAPTTIAVPVPTPAVVVAPSTDVLMTPNRAPATTNVQKSAVVVEKAKSNTIPYASSEPISIPTRRMQCAFGDSLDLDFQSLSDSPSVNHRRTSIVY